MKLLFMLGLPIAALSALYGLLFGPMGETEVRQYVSIEHIVRGPHLSGRSFGKVVSIAIQNSHPRRATPDGLWVACDAFGMASESGRDIGAYQTLRAFQAEPVKTPTGGAAQSVPAHSTAILDFDTQSALPTMNMRTSDTLGTAADTCVVGATQAQALARKGFRLGGSDQQGQMLTVTPLGRNLGLHPGWQAP